jgi:hypothetical protein
MQGAHSLIVHRGHPIPMNLVLSVTAELFGGHLRPDADLAAYASAPVRVHRGASGAGDPLAGTVRGLHLAVRPEEDERLTALSPLVLKPRMGFTDDIDEAWALFGRFPSEAVACALSEDVGALAVLTGSDGPELLGAYSVFTGGRRVWSAVFLPGLLYATWDGNELRTEPMEASDPTPPEGGHTDFPVHGLQLLFGETLELTHQEREALLPTLIHACRPPTTDAEAVLLAREGRFLAPDTPLTEEQLNGITASFVEPPFEG